MNPYSYDITRKIILKGGAGEEDEDPLYHRAFERF